MYVVQVSDSVLLFVPTPALRLQYRLEVGAGHAGQVLPDQPPPPPVAPLSLTAAQLSVLVAVVEGSHEPAHARDGEGEGEMGGERERERQKRPKLNPRSRFSCTLLRPGGGACHKQSLLGYKIITLCVCECMCVGQLWRLLSEGIALNQLVDGRISRQELGCQVDQPRIVLVVLEWEKYVHIHAV